MRRKFRHTSSTPAPLPTYPDLPTHYPPTYAPTYLPTYLVLPNLGITRSSAQMSHPVSSMSVGVGMESSGVNHHRAPAPLGCQPKLEASNPMDAKFMGGNIIVSLFLIPFLPQFPLSAGYLRNRPARMISSAPLKSHS